MAATVKTSPAETTRHRRSSFVILAFILLLAVALRMYRLKEQSVWGDEWQSVVNLDEPDLVSYLKAERAIDFYMVPLYFVIEYFWSKCVVGSVLGLRVLSIIFAALAIPLMYALGRELFGRKAGLVAALCLALSSVHIFQGQEIRNYALLSLAVLFCGYTFVKVLRTGKWYWWTLHFIGSLLVVWTHLFGCFFLVAEGLFLLVFRRRQPRLTGLWFTVNLLLMIPSFLWIRTLPEGRWEFLERPPAYDVVNSVVADCAAVMFNPRPTPGIRWENAPPAWTDLLIETHWHADRALLALFILGVAYLGWHTYRSVRGNSCAACATDRRRDLAEGFWLPVFWCVLPALTLYLVAWTWRPDIYSSKYTTYSSLGLYVLVGGMIESIRRPALRTVAVCVLVLLFGHRVVLYQTQTQRTDWLSVTKLVREERRSDDVLACCYAPQPETWQYNMRPSVMPVERVHDLRALCELTESSLSQRKGVWVVSITWGTDLVEQLERYLRLRRIRFSKRAFWAAQLPGLFVYHIPWREDFSSTEPGMAASLRKAAVENQRVAEELVNKGLGLKDQGRLDAAEAAFREALELAPWDATIFDNLAFLLLTEKQDYPALVAVAQQALEVIPDHPNVYASLAVALDELGEADAAIEAYGKAIERDPEGLPWLYENVAELLLKKGD